MKKREKGKAEDFWVSRIFGSFEGPFVVTFNGVAKGGSRNFEGY